MKKVLLLGATGSIGTQALNIMAQFPGEFSIVGISCGSNFEKLLEISKQFSVQHLHVFHERFAKVVHGKQVFTGESGLSEILKKVDFDILLNALVGQVGVEPTALAASLGKNIALANKEALVCAGERIGRICQQTGARILPIDSEHSAIWQALRGNSNFEKGGLSSSGLPDRHATFSRKKQEEFSMPEQRSTFSTPGLPGRHATFSNAKKQNELSAHKFSNESKFAPVPLASVENVRKIWLTCSGGPFRDGAKWPKSIFKKITPAQALAHPVWRMGQKISIDSATLMNKALEIIEAVRLFAIAPEQIEVVVHPQSILHSAVEFSDGNFLGTFGASNMAHAISHALFFPRRCPQHFSGFSLFEKNLDFQPVDSGRFPSLHLARKALGKGEEFCAKLNSENEKAVADFLAGRLDFSGIFQRLEKSLK